MNLRKNLDTTVFLIFCTIPSCIRLNLLAGPMADKLSVYPIIVGAVYTFYMKRHSISDFKDRIFFRYCCLYILIVGISIIVGAFSFPYFNTILSGPSGQIDKFPYVYDKLSNLGVPITKIGLLRGWVIARLTKVYLIQFIWTFCVSFMIYFWYKDNHDRGIRIIKIGVWASMIIICAYGILELFYLANNNIAKNILVQLNPIIHSVKENNTWWPPLLWGNQMRSVFAEPSYFSMYMVFAFPWLWEHLFDSEAHKKWLFLCWVLNFVGMFFMFLTKARTANVLMLGEIGLLVILTLLYMPDKKKQLLGVVCCCIVAFSASLEFINYTNVVSKGIKATDYFEENIASLANIDKRSNRSRYTIMLTDFRIGLNHPLLGVGTGLRNAYIPDYLPEKDQLSDETKMWVHNQEKNGIFKSGFPSLGEYTSRFAETGALGLIVFLIPPIYLSKRIIQNIRKKSKSKKSCISEASFLISFLGIMASGIGNSLNITYAYWIMLGLGFAICQNHKDVNNVIHNR